MTEEIERAFEEDITVKRLIDTDLDESNDARLNWMCESIHWLLLTSPQRYKTNVKEIDRVDTSEEIPL